jgi:uncharacterized protein (TIGR02145 family)
LTGNKKYYVRAYATNSKGTGYGNQLFFTTSPVEPTVITDDPFPLSPYTAVCGGEITDNGGASVTMRGVCWNTNPSVPPTINDHKTTDGGGSGIFSSNPGSLTPDTEYYIRAYATSSAGTGYGPVKTFKTDPLTITDIDGNVYHVIRIGNQLWIKENLKTTRYRDGVSIPLVSDPVQWSNLLSPAYCWYNNAFSYKDTYGALYNWYAVNTGKLCPAGWHVPLDAEWTILTNFLGGEGIAGGKMKEAGTSHWISPNTDATNESYFTGLPGGVRGATSTFDNMGSYGYHWSNTVTAGDPDFAWGRVLQFDSPEILRRNYYYTKNGFTVRCMRD